MRVTYNDSKGIVKILNGSLGMPQEAYIDGVIQIGHFYIDASYGAYKLCRIVNERGGERDFSPRLPARELANVLHGIISGVELANELKG
jgi:hypothetical protein